MQKEGPVDVRAHEWEKEERGRKPEKSCRAGAERVSERWQETMLDLNLFYHNGKSLKALKPGVT